MKKLTLVITILLFCLSANLFAQDIITLRTGEEVNAKVLAVSTTEIKYKKTSNIEGPTYSVERSKVFMIKYKNGEKDVFNDTDMILEKEETPEINTEVETDQNEERERENERIRENERARERERERERDRDRDRESDRRRSSSKSKYRDWEPDISEYGGKSAIGIQILGEGNIGLVGRQEIGTNIFVETGLHYRSTFSTDEDEGIDFLGSGVMVSGGINFITGKRYKAHKRKIKFNGLFLKGGHSFSEYTENFLAAGWYNETFREDRFLRSVLFELGLGVLSRPWINDPDKWEFRDNEKNIGLIYLRVAWNFYR